MGGGGGESRASPFCVEFPAAVSNCDSKNVHQEKESNYKNVDQEKRTQKQSASEVAGQLTTPIVSERY